MGEKIRIIPTGISGLDEILGGGIPSGHCVLISGNSGTGKTILCHQWLFEGYKKYNDSGIYITLTEPIAKTINNLKNMNFYKGEFLNPLGIYMTDLRSILRMLELEDKEINRQKIDQIIERIENMVRQQGAKRVVIDSITAMGYILRNKELIRYFIFRLGTVLSTLDCISFLTSEVKGNGYSVFGVEEFISDGIILLKYEQGENKMLRKMEVVKMRGVNYRTGEVYFDITSDGLKIYPKIQFDRSYSETNFDFRLSTGIKELDKLLDGGYPQGHIIMIAGNTGTGKTTLALHFVWDGLKKGKSVIYVACEEPVPQIKKTALYHKWNLEKYEEEGKLVFLNPPLIDTYLDDILWQIVNISDKIKAERIVIDSTSSLESVTVNKEKLREFLIELAGFCKTKGITCIMTYLCEASFTAGIGQLLGPGKGSEIRLSSISDGIIFLRYVEREQSVKKLLNILKMRGSYHSRDIYEFEIEREGIKIKGKFKKQE